MFLKFDALACVEFCAKRLEFCAKRVGFSIFMTFYKMCPKIGRQKCTTEVPCDHFIKPIVLRSKNDDDHPAPRKI